MLSYKKLLLIFIISIGFFGFTEKINGQSFHFYPPSTYEPEPGTELLSVSITENSLQNMIFNIVDDQIFITLPDGSRRTIQVGDKSIQNVITELKENIPNGLKIVTERPTLNAQLLKSQIKIFDTLNQPYSFTSRKNVPSVSIDFGTMFSLGRNEVDGNNSLIESSGFILNLIGTHKFYKSNNTFILPVNSIGHLQARISIISDGQLQVSENSGGNSDDQIEQAISQADIFELASQFTNTLVLPNNLEIDVNLFAGLNWTSLPNYEFPETIFTEDSTYTTDDLFDSQQIMNVNAFINSRGPQPLHEVGVSGLLRFKRNNSIAFYTGFGLILKQQLRRGFSFQADSSGIPDPNTLEPRITRPYLSHLKYIVGMRIGGTFNIRADATIPIPNDSVLPQLRLLLSKDFPVIN